MISVSIIVLLFSGCESKTVPAKNNDEFDIDDFEAAMKDKGYDFEIIDVNKDFLPAVRKRMINDDMAIDIYVFDSEEEAEREAGFIDEGGSSYDNGRKAVHVSWISYPHFFKKGCLIVQYVGEDTGIVNDLEDILGEQFAGYIQLPVEQHRQCIVP